MSRQVQVLNESENEHAGFGFKRWIGLMTFSLEPENNKPKSIVFDFGRVCS
jgi:hypothetical protein